VCLRSAAPTQGWEAPDFVDKPWSPASTAGFPREYGARQPLYRQVFFIRPGWPGRFASCLSAPPLCLCLCLLVLPLSSCLCLCDRTTLTFRFRGRGGGPARSPPSFSHIPMRILIPSFPLTMWADDEVEHISAFVSVAIGSSTLARTRPSDSSLPYLRKLQALQTWRAPPRPALTPVHFDLQQPCLLPRPMRATLHRRLRRRQSTCRGFVGPPRRTSQTQAGAYSSERHGRRTRPAPREMLSRNVVAPLSAALEAGGLRSSRGRRHRQLRSGSRSNRGSRRRPHCSDSIVFRNGEFTTRAQHAMKPATRGLRHPAAAARDRRRTVVVAARWRPRHDRLVAGA
jgi:hypothetical protein